MRNAHLVSYTFVTAVSFVYLFIAIALVPDWQTFSGAEIQAYFAGPFQRFSLLMVPVHLLTIVTTIAAFVIHRHESGTRRLLWWAALVTMLVCEVAFSAYFGSSLNPALASGELSNEVALSTLDRWDSLHNVRTAFILTSLGCLAAIPQFETVEPR
ncbi:MAG: DUF1772 domain-containing protein [Myxococcota bacterium]